jgi:hypothetical protein
MLGDIPFVPGADARVQAAVSALTP